MELWRIQAQMHEAFVTAFLPPREHAEYQLIVRYYSRVSLRLRERRIALVRMAEECLRDHLCKPSPFMEAVRKSMKNAPPWTGSPGFFGRIGDL